MEKKRERVLLIMSGILFVAGLLLKLPASAALIVFLLSWFLSGGEIVWKALKEVFCGQVFSENFLMTAATVGAFVIGEYPEAAAVMLFYRVGELLQDIAVDRGRHSVAELMDIRPDFANRKTEEGIRKVLLEEIAVGEEIVVRPGERVPLDGVITEGNSSLDVSALTGESLPKTVSAGDEVLSGSVNQGGLLTVRVTKVFSESTVSRILDLVQNAGSRKAPTENFITKFARYYTPFVVIGALLVMFLPPLFSGAPLAEWVHRGLVFLVVSCPCALVISVPLSFFGGIGGASRDGILIKGSNYLEALSRIDTVVFDKTGTLTKGNFHVAKCETAEGVSPDTLLLYAAYAEGFSGHPIAVSIRQAYGKKIEENRISDYEEVSGKGVFVKLDKEQVIVGSRSFMESEGIALPDTAKEAGTAVCVAVNGAYVGSLLIADEIKPDSADSIYRLKAQGVRKAVMLTGDNKTVAEAVARETGIDRVFSGLLPQGKVDCIEQLEREVKPGGKVVFVGDGINDAPVLARADVGVAMGGVGSDAAIEAADIVLMTDEPSKLADAVQIARKTHRIVWQNIIFALAVKGIILLLGAMGFATMWEAVFGDVGVTLIAILNAARAMWAAPNQK